MRVFSVLLIITFAAAAAWGQATASLQGTITDQSGAVLPGASILVRNEGTSAERMTQADERGNYQIPALAVGDYRVEVRMEGMKPQIVTGLRLEVGQVVVQNVRLEVGVLSEAVTVVGEASVIDTATITVGQVISQRMVQEIPLNGRHFLDLGMLIPGSVTPPANAGLATPLRGQGFFGFNTAGNRDDGTNFLVNGINLNDISNQQVTFQPSINTIDEFKVSNSTFGAEYGRNTGAIVSIATRSGTNEFHGEVFDFLRNDVFDARNFFDVRKPAFRRNQYGGALGGPIVKNRTFFFFSYEGLKHRQGLTLNSGVPTDAQRAAVTDPTVRQLLQFIPQANTGTSTFRGSATAPVGNNQFTIDLNHRVSANDTVHGYYAIQRDQRKEVTAGTTIPGFGDTRTAQRQIFTLNETHTFGTSVVNEARVGFNRIHITFIPNGKYNPAEFGINNGVNEAIALPSITVQGINLQFGNNNSSGRGVMTASLGDTLTYLRGRHSLKIGGEWRPSWSNNFSTSVGTFTFANVNAFVAGTANAFTQTLGDTSTANKLNSLGLFIQDNYKIRPGLTLELGFRYDWNMTPTERYNRYILFDPVANSLVRVGSSSLDKVYHQNAKNFQPRLGFAWDPFGDSKTSVRGAYAILTEQPRNLTADLASNPPLNVPLALPSGRTTTFGRALSDVQASGTIAPQSIDRAFDNAYVQAWNLNIQREIGPGTGVSVGYYGSKGTHLQITRNLNQFINGARPYARLSANSPISPNVGLTNITQRESGGNSSYNALWVTGNKRFSRGLSFNANYTFSKSLDYNSRTNQGIVVQDSYNLRGSRGPSDFDARQRFVISAIYELPFKRNRLVDGWQLSTIVQEQTGNPLNIVSGSTGAFNNNSLTGVANTLRPDLVAAVKIVRDVSQWFGNAVCDPTDPNNCPGGAAFALPVALVNGVRVPHFGSLGRNAVTGPGFNNIDFSILKNTRIGETVRTQFRAEFFDLFNHANFGNPTLTAVPGVSNFGVIRQTRFPTGESGSSRQVQFTLKVIF